MTGGVVSEGRRVDKRGDIQIAFVDSGIVGGTSLGDSGGFGSASDDGFWVQVVRTVVRIIRDGVIYDIVKWVVRKTLEAPPKPVSTPAWGETGCGMGAAGASRF
jgi:hypothetical protein